MAFDLRVYDPLAPLLVAPDAGGPGGAPRYVVTPTDAGFGDLVAAGTVTPVGYGSYVDLGYAYSFDPAGNFANLITSHFSWLPDPRSRVMAVGPTADGTLPRVYDTWTTRYEADGINQQAPAIAHGDPGTTDRGRDGLDNNNNLIADDPAEAEVPPPYRQPLRGLEVVLRVREVDSDQVRQASVVADFVSP